MKILLIDDKRNFLDDREAVIVRSCEEAISVLESNSDFDEAWLDFPVSKSDEFMDFLIYLEVKADETISVRIGKFVIHTKSPNGAHIIEDILASSGYETTKVLAEQYLQ